MSYTPEMRELIGNESVGKTIESLTFDEVDMYWVMSFTDGSEMCFLFMPEVRERIEPLRTMLRDVYHCSILPGTP